MTFLEIERILGFALPESAYIHSAWWANGGHSQAYAWLNAGYKVKQAKPLEKSVQLYRSADKSKQQPQTQVRPPKPEPVANSRYMSIDSTVKTLVVAGYEFHFIQHLLPECDAKGDVVKYYPQDRYDNNKNLKLSYDGNGAFCRFSIDADACPGVYIWLADNNIIYIGETDNLRRRFNMGYGCISPRKCFVGGQSTNCKMNKVVLNLYEQGKKVSLFFYETKDFKQVENELLGKINTQYNMKNNRAR